MSIDTIWILGEPDNDANHQLVRVLQVKFPRRKVCILATRPSIHRDFRRFKRKLINAGIMPTLIRAFNVLRNRFCFKAVYMKNYEAAPETPLGDYHVEYVEAFASDRCLNLVKDHAIKYFLAATDSIIPSQLIRAVPLGIWNAHPGALPGYRGLGASTKMLTDGYFPVISLHLIDEGIDTGPVLFEERPAFTHCENFEELRSIISSAQSKALADLVDLMDKKMEINFRDDFLFASNITHRNTRKMREIESQLHTDNSFKEFYPSRMT